MTTIITLKDGMDEPFNTQVIDVGTSSEPVFLPNNILVDQYGVPIATRTNPLVNGQIDTVISNSFARPANTTAYVSGYLVANSVTAGAVSPMQFQVARENGGACRIKRATLKKSSSGSTAAIFRAHVYATLISTIAGGDGATWSTDESDYVGSFTFDFTGAAVRSFTDMMSVAAVPDVGTELMIVTGVGSRMAYALIEARGAYAPASGETFTLSLEVTQD